MANEADLFERSRLFKSFVLMFVPFHLIGLFLPFSILWATLAWIVCAPLAAGLSSRIGERSVDLLYGLGQRRFLLKQRLAGELDKIRYSKRQKDFDKALGQVNDVLAREPDFPEALFLKAQILCEGFGNVTAAERHLEKVQLVSAEEGEESLVDFYRSLGFVDVRKLPKFLPYGSGILMERTLNHMV